jgi:hypothetical protein
MTRVAVTLILEILSGAADLIQYSAGMFEQARSGIRQNHTATVSLKEILT